MFWHRNPAAAKGKPGWTPPTEAITKPFHEWLNWTQVADAQKIGPTDVHYYLTAGGRFVPRGGFVFPPFDVIPLHKFQYLF